MGVDLRRVPLGREPEVERVQAFLGDRDSAAALVLAGEPGIGKTTLWESAVEIAAGHGCRVLASRPTGNETALAFAGLADLLAGELDAVGDAVPAPRLRALEAALLLRDPEQALPEPQAIAFGVLSVLRALAERERVVVAVDDVQWLDAPSRAAVEFAARRLRDERIALVVAQRTAEEDAALPLGLDRAQLPVERLVLGPLSLGALHALLQRRLGVELRRPTLLRIHEVSAGNPLYALELARAAQDAGADELRVPRSLQELVGAQIARLPKRTRAALEVAALTTEPTSAVVAAALSEPDVEDALAPAIAARILERDGEWLRFTHPLRASVVAASLDEPRRRDLHRRLADAVHSSEERARHLAHSASAPDEQAAAEIEAAARAASARGAPSVAAELAARAVALTDPGDAAAARRRRSLAAEEYRAAGDVERGRTELETIAGTTPPGPERARALLRLAQVPRDLLESRRLCEQALGEAGEDTALTFDILFLAAELDLVTNEPDRADETLRHAIEAASATGDELRCVQVEILRAFYDFSRGRKFDRAVLDRAAEVDAVLSAGRPSAVERMQYVRAVLLSGAAEVDASREAYLALASLVADSGDETAHAEILEALAQVEFRAGNWERWGEYTATALALAEQTGVEHVLAGAYMQRAMRASLLADVGGAQADAQRAIHFARLANDPVVAARARQPLGLLALATGHADAAWAELEGAAAVVQELGLWGGGVNIIVDAAEAAVAAGELERADELVRRLEQVATATELEVRRMQAARTRGLVLAARDDTDGALRTLEAAAAAAERVAIPFERARTLLALGTVQRRAKQRRAARGSLEAAAATFASLPAPLWAARARAELARVSGRTSSGDELTPSEQRIAALVAEGKTNKEVAAALFVTVATVESALTRIYGKLGIRSRTELAKRLVDAAKL